MTTKEKYELIDKSKVSEKLLTILQNMEKSSKNFTDEAVNSRVDSALDKIIEGFKAKKPEALRTITEAKQEGKKEKEKAIKKNEGKDFSDKKDTDDKTGLPKKDTLEERKKIIKKESETEKEARERAKKELEKEKEKAKDEIESQIEKLNRLILEDPALRGFNTGTAATGGGKSTPIIDAERKALPRGRRVSKKGWKNQYGASDGGRKYWENRENRSDRKSPEYETGKPYLAKGGNVYSSDDMYEITMVQDGIELDSKLIMARNKGEARMIFEDMYLDKYQDEFGEFEIKIELAKNKMSRGGGIAFKNFGKTKGRFKLTYEDDGEEQSEIWSSLEEATSSARRYSSPKLGYTNIHIYDETGKEYFFANGGETEKRKYYVLDLKDGKIVSKGFDTEEEAKVEKFKIFEKTGNFFLSQKKMADGGEVEGVDLFEDYDDQPEEVQAILANYDMEDNDYETMQNLKAELESIGYTMDFGLDAEPYDLRKIGQTGKSQFYAKGGKLNTEVILTENRSNGAKWRGVVKPFMMKSIEKNQFSGGFKRYEIDIYDDEVQREPSKEELKQANEFFDKVGGRFSEGGETEGERLSMGESVYFEVFNDDGKDGIIKFRNDGSNIIEAMIAGDIRGFRPKRYMSYLTKKDLERYLNRDFDSVEEVDEEYVQNILSQEAKNKPSDIIVVKFPYPQIANSPEQLTIIKKGDQVFDYDSENGDFKTIFFSLDYEGIDLDDFLEDSVKLPLEKLSPETLQIIKIIKENESVNTIVDALQSKGLIKNYVELAEGGEVDFSEKLEKMRNSYNLLEMKVKARIASAIGIDDAIRIMGNDYAFHPFDLITSAVRSGLLELDEINRDLVYSALMEAENVTEDYRDSGEGIGSSDMTYFTKDVLDGAGYKTAFINNKLKRVDENGNELVIDKYEMEF